MRADAMKNYEHILAVANVVITDHGVDASLRDIARRAGVGLGTLYRHFPTREALLEALLRSSFDEFTAKACELETASSPEDALVSWLREVVAFTGNYQGVVDVMMAAKEDPESALHASCVTMRTAGTRLLARAQAEGLARTDMEGDDLFSLAAALAWLSNQPSSAPRSDHLFSIIASAILTNRSRSN
ncbi:TetR/AcrR family transcriptional regulator [Paenibacillus pabuli]|uniref:TetR/AcrR family transcriptional regulator n=1 Tax=Paenibacillus pabuli TaxID=1472 RepID=UPI000781526F|nr:TetR/AcrR family transcriptional regulator [Paenibacillus pabuli]MEC0123290.1 helix-turn-helix domain containing protein [Paenibacillus pabuli]